MWVLGIEPVPLEEQPVLLTAKPSFLQPHINLFFKRVRVGAGDGSVVGSLTVLVFLAEAQM